MITGSGRLTKAPVSAKRAPARTDSGKVHTLALLSRTRAHCCRAAYRMGANGAACFLSLPPPRDGSVQPGIKLAPFNGQIINGHAQTEEEAGGRQLALSATHIKGCTEVRHAQPHIPSHITCNPTRPPKKKKN